jgi:hypothetical protein
MPTRTCGSGDQQASGIGEAIITGLHLSTPQTTQTIQHSSGPHEFPCWQFAPPALWFSYTRADLSRNAIGDRRDVADHVRCVGWSERAHAMEGF